MSDITAKMTVSSHRVTVGQTEVELIPDYSDGRNKEWAAYTPSAHFHLTVMSEVAKQFPIGSSFLVTFHEED